MFSIDHSVIFPLLAIIILCALAVVIAAYANRG
jgi:cell division protein FtsL